MNVVKSFFVGLLLINALFWGLASHRVHCSLGASLGIKKCVPHKYHITFGIILFIAAVLLQHSHPHI